MSSGCEPTAVPQRRRQPHRRHCGECLSRIGPAGPPDLKVINLDESQNFFFSFLAKKKTLNVYLFVFCFAPPRSYTSCNPLGEIQHVDLFAARPAYVDMSSAGLRSVPSLIARYVRDLRLSGKKRNTRTKKKGGSIYLHIFLFIPPPPLLFSVRSSVRESARGKNKERKNK